MRFMQVILLVSIAKSALVLDLLSSCVQLGLNLQHHLALRCCDGLKLYARVVVARDGLEMFVEDDLSFCCRSGTAFNLGEYVTNALLQWTRPSGHAVMRFGGHGRGRAPRSHNTQEDRH